MLRRLNPTTRLAWPTLAWLVFVLHPVVEPTVAGAALPIISEFMAANVATLPDEDDDFSDWIEILNPDSSATNLGGWFLTDDPDNLSKWSFPNVSLAAGQRMMVFASGKDRRVPGAPLHANFQISSEGEFLALVKPDGTVAFSFGPVLPRQKPDVSYGLVGNTGTNGILSAPTPLSANATTTMEFVTDTKFSHDRGFYETNFNVVITCATPGAMIYYTTNGSPPAATNAGSLTYTVPILVSRTTILRARAEKPGARSSDIDTQTYLFLRDVITQSTNGAPPPGWPASGISVNDQLLDYGMDPDIVNRPPWSATISNDLRAIPTLSIVTKLEDLFDPGNGIYVNAYNSGRAWERPASVELINSDGREGFQLDAGLRIRGNFSRDNDNPKHSFHLFCRDDYGQARLRYPLFGQDAVQEFDRFDLRTAQDDSYALAGSASATYLSDPFTRDTLLALGQPGEHGDWYHLYINGQYWGLYNTCERPEANFAASYFGGAPEDYDVLKPDPSLNQMSVGDGNDAAWIRLWQAAKAGFISNTAYYKVQGRNLDGSLNPAYENLLDVTNLVDYLLTIIYTGNIDGPIYLGLNTGVVNNYYAFRSRQNTGGFRFVAHDSELSLLDVNENRSGTSILGSSGPERMNPHYLATRLRANTEFKMFFADRVQKHFFDGGPMTTNSAIARYSARTNELHQAITAESARWGDAKVSTPITRSNWVNSVASKLRNYFPYRTDIVLDQLRNQGLFPSVTAPRFLINSGEVPSGSSLALSNANPGGIIYYTLDGSDPRGIGGGINASAVSYGSPIIITRSRLVRARVKSGSTWSPIVEAAFYPAQDFGGLRISEIMFHPPADDATSGDEFEFIELKNVGATMLDLGGAFLSGIDFTFTNGTRLAPGAFFVLGRNALQLAAKYPALAVNGIYTGKLANSGERITLHTALGGEIYSVNYNDSAPWPVAADGHSFSLVPTDASGDGDPDNGLFWRASSNPGGSPGADDPASTIPGIVINEILTHTDLPQLDSIEVFNPTAGTVDLGGWYLTDDRSIPQKFRIPDGTTIAAGGYVVFTETDFNSGASVFALDSTGDDVYLFSGLPGGTNLTGYSHGAHLGASANGISFGRHLNSNGEEQFPAQITTSFGAGNSGPRVGPAVINEIHYHPATGDDPFVEILNISGAPLDLFDALHPTNLWRLNGAGFQFPANATLPADGLALIVSTDPTAFRAKYSVPPVVPVFGPFTGSLQNNGERLELQRPDAPNANGVPFITVDEVRYNDHAPWPIAADGDGSSLQRRVVGAYANDPTNWLASGFTPGLTNRATLGPPLSGQPLNQSVTPGADVEFTVAAIGDSLTYQWFFNNAALPTATADTLTLSNVTVANAGGYRVIVSDVNGSATSAVATLTVTCPFALSEEGVTLPSSGADVFVTLISPGGCLWGISNLPSWITFPSGASGSGGGILTCSVASHTGNAIRTASITIAGQPYVVKQSPPDATQPSVSIAAPLANARITNSTVSLSGTAADDVEVARVEYAVDSGPFTQAGGTTAWHAIAALSSGTNLLRVRAFDLNGNPSATKAISVFRVVTSPLTLATNGAGAVSGATNGQLLESGRVYSLTATPGPGQVFSNWTGGLSSASPKLTFLMAPNLAVAANFVPNPFGPIAGKFNGLFYETNQAGGVLHGSSGFFTLTLTDRGTYTASLLSGGFKLAASGQLDLEGKATNTIPRKGTNALVVTWAVALGGSDTLTGSVSDPTNGWQAELNGDRALFNAKTNPCTLAGKYTLLLPGLPHDMFVPGGHSYGTVSIDSNGVVSFKGYLSDKTSAAQKVPLSKNGEWPLYVPLYSGKGSLLSWVGFTNRPTDDFHGLLNWSKPALPTAKYYRDGFNTDQAEVVGSRYAAPVGATNKILPLTDALLTFTGGNLAQDHINSVTLGLGSKVTNNSPHKLTMSFTLSSGLFKGSFTPTNAGSKAVSFAGAVLQKGTNAAGYYLSTNQSGRVLLEPAP